MEDRWRGGGASSLQANTHKHKISSAQQVRHATVVMATGVRMDEQVVTRMSIDKSKLGLCHHGNQGISMI